MSKRVLVVDDEPNIVMSLEFLMRRAGFEVPSPATAGRRWQPSTACRRICCCST